VTEHGFEVLALLMSTPISVICGRSQPRASSKTRQPSGSSCWIIAIADHSATTWIETWDAFLEASRSLITPTVHNALRYAQPPEGIRHYRFPLSTWKHFERLPRLPRGVLPIADALCRFNPIHAQGMSSAAKQARLLDDVLSRAVAEPDPIAHV